MKKIETQAWGIQTNQKYQQKTNKKNQKKTKWGRGRAARRDGRGAAAGGNPHFDFFFEFYLVFLMFLIFLYSPGLSFYFFYFFVTFLAPQVIFSIFSLYVSYFFASFAFQKSPWPTKCDFGFKFKVEIMNLKAFLRKTT